MNKGKIYLHGLDGLKTIAILGVTLYHLFPNTVKGGYLGVVLFFILSGFLLSYRSKIQVKEKNYSVLKYYLKRLKRIYPPLVIVLLSTIGVYYFFAKSAISAIRPEVISILLGYNNIWQIQQNADYFTRIANASPFTHLWYLSIELQFYLIWPVLFFIYRKLGKKNGIKVFGILTLLSAIEMIILYLLGLDPTRMYYGTDTRISALFMGVILGLVWNSKNKSFKQGKDSIIFVLLLIGTVLVYGTLSGQSAILYCGGMFIISILFTYMVWLTISHPQTIGKILDNKAISWCGKHSFSIYLWQYPVIFFFSYKNWNSPIFYVVQILLILLLTVLLDSLLDLISSKERRVRFTQKSMIYKSATAILSMCIVASMIFGTKGVIESSDTKVDSELTQRLDENAKKLEEENSKIPDTTTTEEETEEDTTDYSSTSNSAKVSEDSVILLGDSVLLGASGEVENVLPGCHIDAAVSRYVGEEQIPLQDFMNAGYLKDTVVLCMGTNGILYPEICEQTINMIGPDHSIFWVNNYCPGCEWEGSNNEYLQQLANAHTNITLIDWYSVAANHPEYLASDGIHPNQDGCVVYAQLIKDALDKAIEEQKQVKG